MEKIKTPKCCSFHRRYKKPFAIRVGVYAGWNFDEVCQEISERGSGWPGKSSSCGDCLTNNTTFPSYWMC